MIIRLALIVALLIVPVAHSQQDAVVARTQVNAYGTLFIQLVSRLPRPVTCVIQSNAGAYFTFYLYPPSPRYPNANISRWYPVGANSPMLRWVYQCQ